MEIVMRKLQPAVVLAGAIVVGAIATPAAASLVGATYSFDLSGNTVTGASPDGTYTDPSNPGWCLGPNLDNCVGSGMSSTFSFGESTITFSFFGSTFSGAEPFTVSLSDFDTVDGSTILGIDLASSTFGDSLILQSFDGTTAVFVGDPLDGVFDAVGGASVVFDVTLQPIPLPASFAFLASALAGIVLIRRRTASAPSLAA
jgi:hypothetical protein